jgi:UDP-N-acetylglucosamine 1-carboxyvinyltransferase
MEKLKIIGGHAIGGTLAMHGAKNSALPILTAAILSKGRCEIRNCPDLKDVRGVLRILEHLGCKTEFFGNTAVVDASGIRRTDIPETLMREMRSSFIFLGAILTLTGEARVSYPGGCELGLRPIDIHLAALREMGAEITEESGTIVCKAKRLAGRDLQFSFPSVGATENIMIAATLADGVTTISNAAREPEICDLQDMLNAMGAKVSGAGNSKIVIEGVASLHGARHRVIGDRIAAATYLSAAAITGGDITVTGVDPSYIAPVLSVASDAGCFISVGTNSVSLKAPERLKAVRAIQTQPHPGFPTDAQSPLMSIFTVAEGTTVFIETIFESRYRHVGELARMGARIQVADRVAVVTGNEKLFGAPVACTDLRGGAALIVAALAAEGETVISELQHVDRGYELFAENLNALGANCTREK